MARHFWEASFGTEVFTSIAYSEISSWSDGSPVDYSYYVWRQHDGVLLTCAHDGGSGCGHCYNGDWYGPGYGTDSSEPSSFICKTRPWGH
ncbi:unnamed protein product, partial [Mesorhabditis spiculigera]